MLRFFKQVAHPTVYNEIIDTREDEPIHFELVTGPEGYWERRQKKDWSGQGNMSPIVPCQQRNKELETGADRVH